MSGGETVIRPSLPRYLLVRGTSSTTVRVGGQRFSHQRIRALEVAYFRCDEDVLPRNPAFLDRVSNLLLVLCAGILVCVYFAETLKCVRHMPGHRRCDGSRQLRQT